MEKIFVLLVFILAVVLVVIELAIRFGYCDHEKLRAFQFLTVMIFWVFLMYIEPINDSIRKQSATTENISCVVVDKYKEKKSNGKVIYTEYYFLIHPEETVSEYADSIKVTGYEYSNIEIGETIYCEIIYDSDGIIDSKILG